ncbi:MAG: rhodanese-like domain-containing protein [Candidatus Bathyarchaeota archaeon]|nr:rhodanese-like domain-containing protein [Candidatus Bathyarchaeota archaeon]
MKVSNRLVIIVMVAVAALAVAAGFYTADLWKKDTEYGDVSIDTAIDLMEDKPKLVILDVRTPVEYSEGHIENAVNIPVDALETRLNELNKDDEILVYCRTGNRSSTAIEILDEAGFTKLYHMHEGISVWIDQGHPVVQ